MNIVFTNSGLPLAEVDGIYYDFDRNNYSMLVGELSLNIDLCNLIKNKVVSKINEVISQFNIDENIALEEINPIISNLAELTNFYIVNDIISASINNHKMITTPKPFDKWIWNQDLSEWVPPVPYPSEEGDGIYIWSDDMTSWEPAAPKPHNSWLWSEEYKQYIPPVPYPLDAQEGDFIWDEDRLSWALNV